MSAYQIGYLTGVVLSPLIYMLIIGTIYYWVKKRSIPYRKAILNRWVITSSLVLVLLSSWGRASSYLRQESSHVYPERAVKEFTAGCVESATKRLERARAEQGCACAIAKLQTTYTFGEFKKFGQEMQKTGNLPTGFKEALTSCFNQ